MKYHCIIFFIIILVGLIYLRNNTTQNIIKRDYSNREHFSQKVQKNEPEGIYDKFYSNLYDDLFKSDLKNEFEGMIIHKDFLSKWKKGVNILDIGCGTGEHVKILSRYKHHITGVDQSKYMLKVAKKKVDDKNTNFIQGDFLTPNLFKLHQFSHITCLFHTIYYCKNLSQFFKNCNKWLKPNGYLFLHTINTKKFDPILERASSLIPFFDPQKYVDNRATMTELVFNKFLYRSNWDFGKNRNVFYEQFQFKDEPFERVNYHNFYKYKQELIKKIAKKHGFVLVKVIDQIIIGYSYNYILCFEKKYGM